MISLHRVSFAAVVAVLAVALSGCCVPKGYMVGGDWSLQLNRIPWVEQENCGRSCGPADCGDCISGPTPTGPPIAESQPAIGRFHPVPTRPAFSPRDIEPVAYARPEPRLMPVPQIEAEELPPPEAQSPRPSRMAQRDRRRDDSPGWIFSLPL